ncbi:MAG: hypothetical protein KGD64_07310 [Candidatus Heimdallarchaeota archaeon]|nr:hypothetical protein [Candidatus Heimdallarchaeota archaeon]
MNQKFSAVFSWDLMKRLLTLQYNIPISPIAATATNNHIENKLNMSGFINPITAPIRRGVPVTKNKIE